MRAKVFQGPSDSKSTKSGGWNSPISTWNSVTSCGGSARSSSQDSNELRGTSVSKATVELFFQITSIQWASGKTSNERKTTDSAEST